MESGVDEAHVPEPRRGSIKMERYSPPSGTWVREWICRGLPPRLLASLIFDSNLPPSGKERN